MDGKRSHNTGAATKYCITKNSNSFQDVEDTRFLLTINYRVQNIYNIIKS